MPTIGAMAADTLGRVGVVVNRVSGAHAVLAAASQAEALGYGAAWLTNGGPEDCMPLLAAIALRTARLRLGTSVAQTYPRHPAVLAAEANVIDQLAPGRLRLGIGPSHDVVMAALGLARVAPLAHLGEYLQVTRELFTGQPVDFAGEHYRVRSSLYRRAEVPVMIGALQPRTFELAGRASDGAITWLCPARYLARVGLPAMTGAAEQAGRPRPPLVAHLAVCVHEDPDEARAAVRDGIPNIRFPSYQRMLVLAGLDEAAGGVWTDKLVDEVIAWGPAAAVADRIAEMFAVGADEVLLRPIGAGAAPAEVIQRTVESVAAAITRLLRVPPLHDEERDRDRGGGERREDAGLDQLERPEPVGGLVGGERVVAEAGQTGERLVHRLLGTTAGGRDLGAAETVHDLPGLGDHGGGVLAAGQHHAPGELPEPSVGGKVLGDAVDGGDGGQVVLPDPERDDHADGDEHAPGQRDRRQRPAEQGPGGDPEGDREHRVPDRNDALDVEVARGELVLILGVQRPVPPGDDPGDRPAEEGAREQQPAGLGRQPVPPGDRL